MLVKIRESKGRRGVEWAFPTDKSLTDHIETCYKESGVFDFRREYKLPGKRYMNCVGVFNFLQTKGVNFSYETNVAMQNAWKKYVAKYILPNR